MSRIQLGLLVGTSVLVATLGFPLRKLAANEASYEILIKAPPAGSVSPAEAIASKCAEGFNAAYAKCLGGKNSYLMHLFTDASGKAYCGYQGGWAIPSQYSDHSACFASPGFSEALFYDTATKSLITWDKKVKATEVLMDNGKALNCNGGDSSPCHAVPAVVKNRRLVTMNQQSQVIDKDYSFTWSASMGYVGITTITGGTSQVAMYIKNLAAGDALTSDVPCGRAGSVSDQASRFPVKGLESQCGKQNDDYYLKFADEKITICFPGSDCGAEPAPMDLAAVTEAKYEILIKAPPAGSVSPAEAIASKCAEGFNAAYAKCLGGKNSYLMHLFTDASGKAYCGYQGGWAIPSQYSDHSACFASPGFSEALFYDTATKSLITWDKKVKATEVLMDNGKALNCNGGDSSPCHAVPAVVKNRRLVTMNQQSQVIDKDYSFTWSASMGYVGITTITGGTSQVAMYIKNLAAGDALTSDVPCGRAGSVSDQASRFPVKGLESQCGKQNDDYYLKFADEKITICFPGSAC